MSDPSKSLDSVTVSWESDEEALRHWGHVEQARIVSICRNELEEQAAGDGRLRLGELLTAWDADADVLAAYGHTEEAAALRRCEGFLRSTMNGDETPTGDASDDLPHQARPSEAAEADSAEGRDLRPSGEEADERDSDPSSRSMWSA